MEHGAMTFDLHIGIDYSGRETPISRTPALQVYAASGNDEPGAVRLPKAPEGANRNWCRKEVAEWLIEQARSKTTFMAGIDHGFSFPLSYFERYGLKTWDGFLEDFCQHWPTDGDHTYVDFIREKRPARIGSSSDFRMTDKWTSSAKSVFLFDVQGSVAKSTHAGLPWLRRIRQAVGENVHFWPFDGWKVPECRSAIVEVYPSLVRRRYAENGRSKDQQDAYAVARWLGEMDGNGFLGRFFDPPLIDVQRRVANLEGWIFGVC
jgi:hypothetical protein